MAEVWPQRRSGDFAQALMDLGAAICTPRAPSCLMCPVRRACAAAEAGDPDRLPIKAKKSAKPRRQGRAYALFNRRGEVLLRKRPEQGLLGGMYGLPSQPWTEGLSAALAPPVAADWRAAGAVEHVFTHFHLTLSVEIADAPKGFRRGADELWIDPAAAETPTVMKKAIAAAVRARRG